MMKTTILICTPDPRSRIFRKCLDSVKTYTKDYELIVFDNNYDTEFNHAREINRAMSMAKGDCFVTLDDDVEVEKDWLVHLSKTAEKKKAGIVGCTHRYNNGIINHSGGYVLLDGHAAHYLEPLKKDTTFPYVCSAVMLMDLRLCKKIRFDERFRKYYQDTDFCLFAWEKGIKVISASACNVIHHVGKIAQSKDNITEIASKDFNFFKKKWIEAKRLEKLLKRIGKRVDFGGYEEARQCTEVLHKYHEASKAGSIKLFREVFSAARHLMKRGLGRDIAGGAYYHMGTLLAEAGETGSSVMWLKKCLELIPDHAKAKWLMKDLKTAARK